MKKLLSITIVCLITFTGLTAMAQPGQPGKPDQGDNAGQLVSSDIHDSPDFNRCFVENCETWFQSRYGEDGEVAWATRFGYGVGAINHEGQEIAFTWFAWCNSDAYLQFYFDCDFDPNWRSYFDKVVDNLDRPWSAAPTHDYRTWVGTSNCWMLDDTERALSDDPDYLKVSLGLTIDKMVTEIGLFGSMSVVGYYQ